ncbi:MAG: holo-ACP synthase [Chloroflexales bacterium]|nr:holo-ACP synthase [Chloroflexales bacterium]
MLCHGVDIIEVGRVRLVVERWGERFLRRVYTPGELDDCRAGASTPNFESLAARWAAKEAAAKALGRGLSGLAAGAGELLHFHDLEVARGPGGRPVLRLHGGAAAAAAALGLVEIALSLSHTHEHAIASVIGLGAGPAPQAPSFLLQ